MGIGNNKLIITEQNDCNEDDGDNFNVLIDKVTNQLVTMSKQESPVIAVQMIYSERDQVVVHNLTLMDNYLTDVKQTFDAPIDKINTWGMAMLDHTRKLILEE